MMIGRFDARCVRLVWDRKSIVKISRASRGNYLYPSAIAV